MCQAAFPCGWTVVRSRRQRIPTRVCVLHPCQHLVLPEFEGYFLFVCFSHSSGISWFLFVIPSSLKMMSTFLRAYLLFTYLLHWLVCSYFLPIFLFGRLSLYRIVIILCLFWISVIWYMCIEYFLPFRGLSFDFLMVPFKEQFLILIKFNTWTIIWFRLFVYSPRSWRLSPTFFFRSFTITALTLGLWSIPS